MPDRIATTGRPTPGPATATPPGPGKRSGSATGPGGPAASGPGTATGRSAAADAGARPGAVTVLGAGLLHDVLTARAGWLATALPPGLRVTVTAADHAREPEPAGATPAAGHVVLPVRAEPHAVVAGPLWTAGRPGCPRCVSARRAAARSEAESALLRAYGGEVSGLLSAAAAEVVAVLARRVLRGHDGYLRLDLGTMTVTAHRLLADPLCPDCGDLPPDGPEAARIELQPRPKRDPRDFRVRDTGDYWPALTGTFVDPDGGLIARVERGDESGFAVAKAPVRLRTHDGREIVESGWGRSDDYRTSDVVAMLEALERWGGVHPGGRRTTVHASFAELGDDAVDPRRFGLPQRATDGFQRFDENVACHWVWAWSFGRERAVLVPEGHAYYGIRLMRPHEPRFADEISNGCAIGGCLEEAILYGLFEVAERDGFLTTWYTRFPRLRIRPAAAARERIARIARTTGYTVDVYDTTMETGIPSVWAMAVHPAPGPDDPKAVVSGGAHLDRERAVRSALTELGPVLGSVRRSYPQHRDRVAAMVEDSHLVRRMTDHSLLYAAPAAYGRMDFLTGTTGEAEPATPRAPRADLRDDVRDALDGFLRHGLDVLVVDQTTDEHRAAGLACVKVLVPGTLPMSFGHTARRTHGLPRLFTVPGRLGHPRPPARPEELNPYPHPFA